MIRRPSQTRQRRDFRRIFTRLSNLRLLRLRIRSPPRTFNVHRRKAVGLRWPGLEPIHTSRKLEPMPRGMSTKRPKQPGRRKHRSTSLRPERMRSERLELLRTNWKEQRRMRLRSRKRLRELRTLRSTNLMRELRKHPSTSLMREPMLSARLEPLRKS